MLFIAIQDILSYAFSFSSFAPYSLRREAHEGTCVALLATWRTVRVMVTQFNVVPDSVGEVAFALVNQVILNCAVLVT